MIKRVFEIVEYRTDDEVVVMEFGLVLKCRALLFWRRDKRDEV